MDTNPFDEYLDEAEAVARSARNRTGLDWEVYVSETHSGLNWYKQAEEQVDGPSLQFDGGILSIEVYQNQRMWTIDIYENHLVYMSMYAALEGAVHDAYEQMMTADPEDVFV